MTCEMRGSTKKFSCNASSEARDTASRDDRNSSIGFCLKEGPSG